MERVKFRLYLPTKVLLVHNNGALVFRTDEYTGYGFTAKGLFIHQYKFYFDLHTEHWRTASELDEQKFINLIKEELKERKLIEGSRSMHSSNKNLVKIITDGINYDESGIYTNSMQYLYYKQTWAKPYEAIYCDNWSSIDLDCPQYVFFGKESNKEWVKDDIGKGFETGNSVNCLTTDKLDTSKNKTGADERLGYIKELEEKIEYLENRNENLFRQKMLMDVTIMNLLLPKEEPKNTEKWWRFRNREKK